MHCFLMIVATEYDIDANGRKGTKHFFRILEPVTSG